MVAALSIFMVSLSKSGLIAALGIVGVPLLTLVSPAQTSVLAQLAYFVASGDHRDRAWVGVLRFHFRSDGATDDWHHHGHLLP